MRNKEEHQRKIDEAIIIAAHPTSHPNTPGNGTPAPRSGDRLPADPLAPEHASAEVQAPETNGRARFTDSADANLEKEKSTF